MPDPFYSQWLLHHLEPMPPSTTNPLTWFVTLDLLQHDFAAAARRAGRAPLDASTVARGVIKHFVTATLAHAGGRMTVTGVRYHRTNPIAGDVRYG